MAPTYNHPTVEPIVEDAEDESFSVSSTSTRGFGHSSHHQDPSYQRHHTSERDPSDKIPQTSISKAKSKKSHRSSSNSTSTKHSSRTKAKTQPYLSTASAPGYPQARRKHARPQSGRNANSAESSDSDGEEPIEDHRVVLEASRGRLTSPSVFSVQTSLTTATNTSSGSSGSNSTVTQASVSKGSVEKRAEGDEAPPSPAVPDPPLNVFAYMEHDSIPESFASSAFTSSSTIPQDTKKTRHTSASSTSSSFHSDNASEQAAGFDTDRSTSPERSVKGDGNDDNGNAWDETPSNHDNDGYTSSASAKYEAQLLAAREQQDFHEQRARQYRARTNAQQPTAPTSQALSPRSPYQPQTLPPGPQPEEIPCSGYDQVAQALASPTRRFQPIYRRFEGLNHRVLLNLQDEIGELEEELKRMDDWDTNSRSFGVSVSVPLANPPQPSPQLSPFSIGSANPNHVTTHDVNSMLQGPQATTRIARHIHPSSRRHEFRYPSEVGYRRTQLLQTLQYKLALYNSHLKTFDDTARLPRPVKEDIDGYRQFLRWERPVVDAEARHLDEAVEEDLIVLGGGGRRQSVGTSLIPSRSSSRIGITTTPPEEVSTPPRYESHSVPGETTLPIPLATVATALAAAFLVPILTFSIIPNWLGRMTVVLLVGAGVWGSVWQSGDKDREEREWMVGGDMLVVAGVYGLVLGVVAAVVG